MRVCDLVENAAEWPGLKVELFDHVRKEIGPIAVPDKILFHKSTSQNKIRKNYATDTAQSR